MSGVLTYRAWKSRTVGPSARSVSDAHLLHTIRSVIYTPEGELTPEGLYGRRKLTAYLRRTTHPEVAFCTVDRCMRILGHHGVRRAKKVRTTIPSADGKRAGDLLHRNFTAPAPNLVWVTDI